MILHTIFLFSSFASFANDNSGQIEWRNGVGKLIDKDGIHYYTKNDESKFLLITKNGKSKVYKRMVYTKNNDTYTVYPIKRNGEIIQLGSKGEEIWNATAYHFFNVQEKKFNEGSK